MVDRWPHSFTKSIHVLWGIVKGFSKSKFFSITIGLTLFTIRRIFFRRVVHKLPPFSSEWRLSLFRRKSPVDGNGNGYLRLSVLTDIYLHLRTSGRQISSVYLMEYVIP